MRTALFIVVSLATAQAAGAAQEVAGHGGIPWWEIFKQAVNFGILVGVLVYFLRKPVNAYLKERAQLLRNAINEAARARATAAESLLTIENRLHRLPEEIAEMNRKMEAEADEETRRLHEAAAAEIERLRAQVRFAAEQEVKSARMELRREAADLSARAAEEIVAKTVTPQDQERMVKENIGRIRGIMR